jgi:hypothetical protein
VERASITRSHMSILNASPQYSRHVNYFVFQRLQRVDSAHSSIATAHARFWIEKPTLD